MSLLARLALLTTTPTLVLVAGVAAPEPFGGAELGVSGRPVVAAGEEVPELELPDFDVESWLVADLDSGGVLAALNAHTPLPPASTIKLLTALVALPVVDPDISYVATDADARVGGSRVGLVPEETYTWADLAHGLLLGSGNDTAHALAELAGGQQVAIDLMNAEAARLGAVNTRARTPHGLHEPGQVSSTYDLALVARAVLEDESLAALVQTRTYDFPGLDGDTFQIQNQNRLLGRYAGTIGMKTGYTSESGHTLVAAAERDGVRLVATVLGADGRGEPVAEALLDWGFTVAGMVEPVGVLVTPEEVEAAGQAGPDVPPDKPGNGPVAEAADPGEPEPDPTAAGDPLLSGPGTPWWTFAAAGALGAAVLAGLIAARRARRRSTGRYSR